MYHTDGIRAYRKGHAFGVRVDGTSSRRFLSLTAFQAEGCGGGFAIGHTLSGVRVQRVQKVQRVQRVQRVVVAASPQVLKKGRGWRRRLCRRVVSPQGKRLTMICASLALLHPLLSLTHWIFRSLMLPYKSSSHSANHVCCASLRSGSKETRKLAAFPMDMQGFETSTHRKLSLRFISS